MDDSKEIMAGSAANRLLEIVQQPGVVHGLPAEVVRHLQEAAEQAAREYAELIRREQAARAEAERAQAEAASTRAKAEQAVKALAESEQRYRYMGETIPFGVWWCNPKGEAEYVSPSFCELLDMTLEEQKKFGWTKRLVPEDVEPMMTKWLHCCETGTPWDHEHRIIDRYGKVHTVLSRGLPVRDEAGQVIAWVGVNLDITERKRIELQLKEAKEALEQALTAKDQFMANISHELRTPLTLVLGPVQKMLQASNLTEQQRHDLAIVERNARTLLKNVNDLLDLSKLDAGRMRIEYVHTDLAWLARYVASHFEIAAGEKGIDLVVETPPSLPAAVDSGKLQRVLFNLMSNALKFTPAQGMVRFTLRAESNKAVVTVEDTGPGVPPEMREAIFERFRQLDSSSTRRHGGTGLGLAIVKEFVSLHKGSVSVSQAPGGGARFSVEVPLAAPPGTEVQVAEMPPDEEGARAAVAELEGRAAPSEPGNSSSADAPLVLVVEDNLEMNDFVARSLANHCRVAKAFDGREGLDKAQSLRPDLIISDIMMPRMSGEDMVRELRRCPDLDDVPILLLTAKADETLRIRLLSNGVQDCMVKPFVTEELVARATGLIERKRAGAELKRRTQQLQKLTLELSQAEERERRRIAVILHEDLQQQIAGARFHLSLMKSRAQDGRQRADIERADEMLMAAIEQSRNLSRDLSPPVVRMADLTETLPWLANRVREQKGLDVHVSLSGNMTLHSEALGMFLLRAAQEMLLNVVKHARVKEADIRVRRIGRHVCLTVSDQGRGFNPRELKETSGVGLFSLRERTEQLGGRVKIKSAKGKGSRLSIMVPDSPTVKYKKETAEDTADLYAQSPAVVSSPSDGALRVLLVDDHDIVREGLAALLNESPDIEVVGEAPDGREAINLAIDLRPDVVVMDVSMPVMSGDQATRQIKTHVPRTRVIALSMYDEADKRERMYQAGAEGYVLKTASVDEILASIRGRGPDS